MYAVVNFIGERLAEKEWKDEEINEYIENHFYKLTRVGYSLKDVILYHNLEKRFFGPALVKRFGISIDNFSGMKSL
jgi:hypothetical protein